MYIKNAFYLILYYFRQEQRDDDIQGRNTRSKRFNHDVVFYGIIVFV